MGRSNTATLVLFLSSLATVAAIAAFYAMSAAAGWTFGVASASLAVAAALICVVLGAGSYLRHRKSQPSRRLTARLNQLNTPAQVRPDSSLQQPGTVGPTEVSETPEPVEDPIVSETGGGLSDRIHKAASSDPTAPLDQQPPDVDPTPPEEEPVVQGPDDAASEPAPQIQQSPIESESIHVADTNTAHPQPEPSEPPVPAPTPPAIDRDTKPDPKRLAEILNIYEDSGFPPNGHFDRTTTDQSHASQPQDQRDLWSELVAEYGAESIDMRNAETGQCRITLTSGDMVFYSPERRSWLWIAFEQTEPESSSLLEALSADGTLVNPNGHR